MEINLVLFGVCLRSCVGIVDSIPVCTYIRQEIFGREEKGPGTEDVAGAYVYWMGSTGSNAYVLYGHASARTTEGSQGAGGTCPPRMLLIVFTASVTIWSTRAGLMVIFAMAAIS